MAKISFYVGEKLLGTSACPDLIPVHEQWMVRKSIAYVCPHCASVWAKAVVEAENVQQEFCPHAIPCRECNHRPVGEFPGSLYLTWSRSYNALFPAEVLAYELNNVANLIKEGRV